VERKVGVFIEDKVERKN